MRKRPFYIFAIILSTTFASIGNQLTSMRSCIWYIYDNPTIINPIYDFPYTLTEALTQNNYRPATNIELIQSCYGFRKLCAICAEPEVNNPYVPNLSGSQPIYNELLSYFSFPEEERIPNLTSIREKFFE